MSKKVLKTYDTILDSKKRCTIEGVESIDHYRVTVYEDGSIEMIPSMQNQEEKMVKPSSSSKKNPLNILKKQKDSLEQDFEDALGESFDADFAIPHSKNNDDDDDFESLRHKSKKSRGKNDFEDSSDIVDLEDLK